MSGLTYRELKKELEKIEELNLDNNVTIYSEDSDEFYQVSGFSFVVGNDVLDDGHPILIM